MLLNAAAALMLRKCDLHAVAGEDRRLVGLRQVALGAKHNLKVVVNHLFMRHL
jgi:hypothetical protein